MRRGVGDAFPFVFGRDLLVDGPGLGAFGDGAGEGEFSEARGDFDIERSANDEVEEKMQSQSSSRFGSEFDISNGMLANRRNDGEIEIKRIAQQK